MRSPASSLLFSLLLFTPISAAPRSECLRAHSRELASLAACGGDKAALAECFAGLPTSLGIWEVQECLAKAGCTTGDAGAEAFWTLKRCETAGPADLRRRGALFGRADDEAKTASTSTSSTITSPAGTATSLVCLATKTGSTTACPVSTLTVDATRTSLSTGACTPTTYTYSTCAAGLLCRTSPSGKPICMRKDDSFHAAGTAISLFFAVAIAGGAAAMTFFCCRERSTQRRLVAAAEAAAIAREAAEKPPRAAVRSASGGYAGGGYAEQGDDYDQPLMGTDQDPRGQPGAPPVLVVDGRADPFADGHRI